jgi:C4-dicarboxylate transporter DctM subunit
VLFALLTEASIGQLFIASMIPAIVVVIAYLLNVWLYVRLVPASAPPASRPEPGALLHALKRSGPITFLFVVCLGGMYIGVFTVTESAAIGAFGAFLAAVFRGKLGGGAFGQVIAETMSVTAMVYGLIFGGLIFSFFCEVSDLSEITARYLATFHFSPLELIFLLLAVFIVLGTFMDSYAVMIATIPIVTPLVTKAGYDLIWWGVINLFVIEIGNISPPFGLNMFVLKSIDDTPLATIFKGVTSFCIAAIVTLVVLVLFPEITMWLPSHMTP